MEERYDLIVIGNGAAGDSVARPAAGTGKRVALVERDKLGGECLNYGCVPSKTLYQSAAVYHAMRNAGEFGVRATGVELDFAAVMERAQSIIGRIRGDDPWGGVRRDGIDGFNAAARFVSPHELEVDGRRLLAEQIVIATGTKAGLPPVPGLAESDPLTNESIWGLRELPGSLAVIGAGPIGVEMAQIFQRFGSRVTLIEALPRVLPTEDREISELLEQVLRREGIEVITGSLVRQVERVDDGRRRLQVDCDHGLETIDVDQILVAAGREPQTADLNLAAAGLDTEMGWLPVDEHFRTSQPHIWAAGDVIGGMQFTHVASAEAGVVFRNAILGREETMDYRGVPYAIFADPEVGHVGITEREARERGLAFEVSRFDPTAIDRSIIAGEQVGLIKLIATPGGEEILGAHIIASRGGDLINEMALAMQQRLTVRQLADTVHAYPTAPESLRWVSTSFLGE